jgi:hypothetical protein
MVATVCFGLFVALTISKVIAGVVQYRRRPVQPQKREPRRIEAAPAYHLAT